MVENYILSITKDKKFCVTFFTASITFTLSLFQSINQSIGFLINTFGIPRWLSEQIIFGVATGGWWYIAYFFPYLLPAFSTINGLLWLFGTAAAISY